jgi:glycine oxidase
LENYDVAVIGGGVIGSSIAYSLAKRGKRVVVLERDRIGCQASSAAAGMLAVQAEMQEGGPLFELARQSRSMFPRLAEELKELTGIDIGLVNKGMLLPALTISQVEHLHALIASHKSAGESCEWWSTEEVIRHEPKLSNALLGAMFIPGDGQVLAPKLTQAFAKSAIMLGAEIKEYTQVHGIQCSQHAVVGVHTNQGDIMCDQVVVAAGVWSHGILQSMNLPLTVFPVKGECFAVIDHAPLLQATVFTDGCYLVPKRGGRLVIGATVQEHTFDKRVSAGGIATLMERATQLLPDIAKAEWDKAWTGLRPQTPDGIPYLGRVDDIEGMYLATGHYRNGILLSPITGEIMADLVEGRSTIDLDLSAFHVARIA